MMSTPNAGRRRSATIVAVAVPAVSVVVAAIGAERPPPPGFWWIIVGAGALGALLWVLLPAALSVWDAYGPVFTLVASGLLGALLAAMGWLFLARSAPATAQPGGFVSALAIGAVCAVIVLVVARFTERAQRPNPPATTECCNE